VQPKSWIHTTLLTSGSIGVAVAALGFFLPGPLANPISSVLVLAVAAIVPFGLASLSPIEGAWNRLLAIAACAQPIAAACAVTSLSMSPGRDAGLWCVPWMTLALLVACMGLMRLFQPGALRRPAELCAAAALLYLPAGAGWLVLSRMGARPLDFDPVIVALTAVHFHFAAFAAPILASRTISALEPHPRARRIAAACGLAIVVAQMIVAAGITASAPLALAGALVFALALGVLSIFTLWRVVRTARSAPTRVLLGLSAIVPLASMPLAVLWSYGDVTGEHLIGLERMIDLHGIANALGFSLAGLLAWAIEARRRPS
jgi:hypothetical protein